MPIKVLIVDDSAIVRKVLARSLGSDPEIDIVGTAPDPLVASDKIEELRPDILTLDIEMPRMDGITFLKGLMRHHPLPVIIVSSITPKGGKLAIDALDSGAVDVVCKPGAAYSAENMANELADKIKLIALSSNIKPQLVVRRASVDKLSDCLGDTSNTIVAIGASTGGTKALADVLSKLPANFPATFVVQHMPAGFTQSFAERLNQSSALDIVEAADNTSVIPGRVLIAPGNKHMVMARSGARFFVKVIEGPRVQRQRPSVDVLFESIAAHGGTNAIGVILTGMGSDGAYGMLGMKKRGAVTIAQDESSCVVFGMPKEAIKLGAVDHIVPLNDIPETLIKQVRVMAE